MYPRIPPRIFLADLEYVLVSIVAQMLLENGWDARAFGGTSEALKAALSAPPDILVCNVKMLPLSGLEFAMRMRRHSPNCKVLLFSNCAGTNSLLESVWCTTHDFLLLRAPVHLNELLHQIHCASGPQKHTNRQGPSRLPQ